MQVEVKIWNHYRVKEKDLKLDAETDGNREYRAVQNM